MDVYRQSFNFLLPDDKPYYNSLVGSIMSLFTVIVLLSYGIFKIIKMNQGEDYKINQVTHVFYYESGYGFKSEDGFQVAAGVTSYDGDPNPIEDPEIGEVKFYLK